MLNATKTLVILLTAILFACGSQKNKNRDGEKPVVTVSILPIKTFVEEIAGNDFEINVLLAPGASPADFTLIPSQLKDIARSEVWFRIGYIGFEFSSVYNFVVHILFIF